MLEMTGKDYFERALLKLYCFSQLHETPELTSGLTNNQVSTLIHDVISDLERLSPSFLESRTHQ